MDWIQFQHAERAWLFLALLALLLWMIWRIAVRSDKLDAFVSKAMQARLVTRPTLGVQVLQVVCLAVSGILFILALMQPQVVRQERVVLGKDSANIYVALDVSKSMLATDVAPDRLGRAKSEIRDMLPSFSSHRVGLLAFSGRTTVLSPLTMDHGFFRLALDSASPWSVTLGGTNLGEVIRKATKLLSEQEGPKALILITDGEDHETYPLEAAEEARRAGVNRGEKARRRCAGARGRVAVRRRAASSDSAQDERRVRTGGDGRSRFGEHIAEAHFAPGRIVDASQGARDARRVVPVVCRARNDIFHGIHAFRYQNKS